MASASAAGSNEGGAAAGSFDKRVCVTCSAPNNIATIKYWGKRDAKLNVPINSSVSVTLSQDVLKALTTAGASKSFKKDRLWLNGKEEDVQGNSRLEAVFRLMREIAGDRVDPASGEVIVKAAEWREMGVHVVSMNTFPTAAGLASSAAGFAALTFALANLMCAKEQYKGQFTAIARQGSGSSCRSLMGGYVRWEMGKKADGTDSIGVQVADENHWPSLRALILVASSAKKGTSSTGGMGTSVKTSKLLAHRSGSLVHGELREQEAAFLARDFAKFGEITMRDSNQFHATCLDTYPPIFYMNDISKGIIQAIHAYNDFHGRVKAAYTFDAGPNAVIYTEVVDQIELLSLLLKLYPSSNRRSKFVSDPELEAAAREHMPRLPSELVKAAEATAVRKAGDVQYVYCSPVGDGPRLLGEEDSLMDLATGLPLQNGQGRSCKKGKHLLTMGGTVVAAAVSVALGIVLLKRRN